MSILGYEDWFDNYGCYLPKDTNIDDAYSDYVSSAECQAYEDYKDERCNQDD